MIEISVSVTLRGRTCIKSIRGTRDVNWPFGSPPAVGATIQFPIFGVTVEDVLYDVKSKTIKVSQHLEFQGGIDEMAEFAEELIEDGFAFSKVDLELVGLNRKEVRR